MVNWYSFPTLGVDTYYLLCNGPAMISSRFKHVILVQVLPFSSFKLKFTGKATVSFYVFHGDMSLIGVKCKCIFNIKMYTEIKLKILVGAEQTFST